MRDKKNETPSNSGTLPAVADYAVAEDPSHFLG